MPQQSDVWDEKRFQDEFGDKAVMESLISQQKAKNVKAQTLHEQMTEPLGGLEFGQRPQPGQPDKRLRVDPWSYIPAPFRGAIRTYAGDLASIGRGALETAETATNFPGVGPLRIPKGTTEALAPDPYAKVQTAGRFGQGEPLSMYSGAGKEYAFGPAGGSQSMEKAGSEVAKFSEMVAPAGIIKRGVAAVPEFMQGAVRSYLEAANAGVQAQLHGDDPMTAAGWAGLMPILGRIFAKGLRTTTPKTPTGESTLADWFNKEGRRWYGGVFNPRTLREKVIASEAIDPLMSARKGYFGDRVQLPEGIFTTRGQIERFGEKTINAAEREKYDIINAKPGALNFPVSYDDFSRDLDTWINNKLMATNPNTGQARPRSPEAQSIIDHLNDLRKRAEDLSEPGAGGTKTIPHNALMNLKDDAQRIVAAAGGYAEKAALDIPTGIAVEAKKPFATAAQMATERTDPKIAAIDKKISEWVDAVDAIKTGDLKSFGRVETGASKVMMGGPGHTVERGLRYAQMKTAFTLWEKFKALPLSRTTAGKGILINIGRAIERGDFDGATSMMGRAMARIKAPRLPELQEMTPEQEEQVRQEALKKGSATGKPAARLGTDEPFPEGGPPPPRFNYDRNTGQLIPVP